jgi:hypothetical protein
LSVDPHFAAVCIGRIAWYFYGRVADDLLDACAFDPQRCDQ